MPDYMNPVTKVTHVEFRSKVKSLFYVGHTKPMGLSALLSSVEI